MSPTRLTMLWVFMLGFSVGVLLFHPSSVLSWILVIWAGWAVWYRTRGTA